MIVALGAIISSAAIISINSGLGYILPALIGLESMGIPSPGETALVLAAVLASQGKLNIVVVIAIAAASAIVGDNIGYLLGRRLGRDVLTSRGPMQARRVKMMEIGDRYFGEHGAKTVFIGRWIALIRFATAWLAGINHMRFRTFFFWNALGGITWATAYGVAGYLGGNAVIHVMEKVGIVAAIVVGIAIVVLIVMMKLKERKVERELEADTADQDRGANI
jgi:membrane protein DedA with SNARE-associated domain